MTIPYSNATATDTAAGSYFPQYKFDANDTSSEMGCLTIAQWDVPGITACTVVETTKTVLGITTTTSNVSVCPTAPEYMFYTQFPPTQPSV
jgi:hypothetical protein